MAFNYRQFNDNNSITKIRENNLNSVTTLNSSDGMTPGTGFRSSYGAGSNAEGAIYGMYDGLKAPRNAVDYALMRGVTDFGAIEKFNLYETGYSFLVVVGVPQFLLDLATTDGYSLYYKHLLQNYVEILENEFRGLSGLESLSSDTLEITDGISQMQFIGKVNMQSASTISMNFFEKSGTPITRLHRLFLEGIKDPRTQIKTYKGLLKNYDYEAGYDKEVFTLLYIVTDNTIREVESAYLLIGAQPTTADLSIFESEKGSIENKEISVEMNCFPVTGRIIYNAARDVLDWLNSDANDDQIIAQSDEFFYSGTEKIYANTVLRQNGATGSKLLNSFAQTTSTNSNGTTSTKASTTKFESYEQNGNNIRATNKKKTTN